MRSIRLIVTAIILITAVCTVPCLLAQNSPFDLNSCQRECRLRFGLEPQADMEEHFRRGSGTGNYYEYANCIAGCNAQFWKEFDNNTRNLERQR